MSIAVTVTNDGLVVPTITSSSSVAVTVTGGVAGVGIPAGGATGEVLKKTSGTDYDTEWAAASTVITFAMADNQASPATIFSYAKTNKAAFIKALVTRGTLTFVGDLNIGFDGTNLDVVLTGSETGDTGVTFLAVENGANVDVQYTSTSTGTAPSISYTKTLL